MSTTRTEPLTIDVWSDIMCPFCYLGDTVLEQALAEFPERDRVQVRYHSYQLMPELGTEPVDLNELLAGRYSPEQMRMQNESLAARGAELGLEYRFDRAITVNTRAAHEVAHFAESQGKGHEMMRMLFQAYFTDGKNIGDVDTLVDLATEIGLDGEAAREALSSQQFDETVTDDIEQARQLGVQGVPFFVFDSKYALSGAQPQEVFAQALDTAWNAA